MEYLRKNKWTLIALAICLSVILLSSVFASLIQSDWGKVTVTDLRDAENEGTKGEGDAAIVIKGKVVSGILFVPKSASATNKLPAIVLMHGYLNNRELQLQNAIELARRGFIVLTVDREGHGNYENEGETGALMATNGLYDSAKYLYNLDYVDQSKIGISGHSMGGYTTAMTLFQDSGYYFYATGEGTDKGYDLQIISAGLMQGWSMFIAAGPTVSVGNLKAKDDEFFYTGKLLDGTDSISRQYLQSDGAATFVQTAHTADGIENGGIYIGGVLTDVAGGQSAGAPFRAVYESDEIHPLNHFSTESAGYVVNFFYTAFGTPTGYQYKAENKQAWVAKKFFSFLGLLAFFACIIPGVKLLLTTPIFASLKKKEEEGEEVAVPELRGVQKHISYWIVGVAVTLFSGFIIKKFATELGDAWFPNTQLYPQDTTNWVALWAIGYGLFAALATGIVWIANAITNRIRFKDDYLAHSPNPFAAGKIESFAAFAKTLLLAATVVCGLYLMLFANWGIFKVDFRIWSFDIKVFDVGTMFPTTVRYMLFFGIFFTLNAILNQNYRVKNLTEWATIAINAFFNCFGILLVMLIQYGTFRTTGVLWQEDMALGYIVLFPIIPVLIIATIISRMTAKETGNAWLGAFINTILFTMITVANTASSFSYVMG